MCAITLRVCMQAYAKLRTDTPELLDLVAQFGGQDLTDDPMAVDGESSAPVANSGEFVGNKNNKISMVLIIIVMITINIIIATIRIRTTTTIITIQALSSS